MLLRAILRKGHAGSGMHFHLSPVINGEHQPNHTSDGALRDPAKWLIGAWCGTPTG